MKETKNTNQCIPPKEIPYFFILFSSMEVLDDDAPEACKTKLKEPDKTQCQTFTTWTHYTASICGVFGLAAQIVNKSVSNKKIALKIVLSLKTAYDGISGVNEQFLAAIVDINAGKPYEPIPVPDTIPPFPTPTDGSDVEQAVVEAWNALRPWIDNFISKLPSDSPWIKVLEGIIESSDKMITDLQKLFKEIEG
jgi:hypothetical protein